MSELQPDAGRGPEANTGGTPVPKTGEMPDVVTAKEPVEEREELANATAPRVRLPIEDALPFMEQSVRSMGISPEQLRDRVKLDGISATDHMEVFNLVNVYFGAGLMYDDGKPRQMIAVGVDRAFELDSVWAHVAYQLGRGKLEAEGAKQFIDKTIAERIGTETPHRGAEAFHLSVWISPIELVQSNDRAKAFLQSVHDLVDQLDILNENYGATVAIFCPLPETVLPEHVHDTIVSLNKGRKLQ